ncbi:hypothetical protein [Blastomonas fulva]|uniref:hypothetical protein n=1 Tax=Blastomonas fulva TaxID=1550728 RepID=UPI003F6FA7E4
MESKIVIGLMLMFTLIMIVGVVWPVLHYAPRRMEARKAANIARHAESIAALEVALTRTGNDPALHGKLARNLAWQRASLRQLAPENPAAREPGDLSIAA